MSANGMASLHVRVQYKAFSLKKRLVLTKARELSLLNSKIYIFSLEIM